LPEVSLPGLQRPRQVGTRALGSSDFSGGEPQAIASQKVSRAIAEVNHGNNLYICICNIRNDISGRSLEPWNNAKWRAPALAPLAPLRDYLLITRHWSVVWVVLGLPNSQIKAHPPFKSYQQLENSTEERVRTIRQKQRQSLRHDARLAPS